MTTHPVLAVTLFVIGGFAVLGSSGICLLAGALPAGSRRVAFAVLAAVPVAVTWATIRAGVILL